MNNSGVPTYKKIMIPMRISPELYDEMLTVVQKRKRENRGYSMNQYLTEMLSNALKEEKKRK